MPTASHGLLDIKMLYRQSVLGRLSAADATVASATTTVADNGNGTGHMQSSNELILLCNLNLPEKVFSFLKLSYRSPFTLRRNWVRLYRDNDLCSVE